MSNLRFLFFICYVDYLRVFFRKPKLLETNTKIVKGFSVRESHEILMGFQ